MTPKEDIRQVIRRTTGNAVSNIDGPLKTEVGPAEYFFSITPTEIVFEPNPVASITCGTT